MLPDQANANLYLDGELTTNTQSMHFPKTAKGGVLMANSAYGRDFQLIFKNLELI